MTATAAALDWASVECQLRTARNAWPCQARDHTDGCQAIEAGDVYVEYLGEAPAYSSGVRYSTACAIAAWAPPAGLDEHGNNKVDDDAAALAVLTELDGEWASTSHVAYAARFYSPGPMGSSGRGRALRALGRLERYGADVERRDSIAGKGTLEWRYTGAPVLAAGELEQDPADNRSLAELLDDRDRSLEELRARIRREGAELKVLEDFDDLRSSLGHDYGNGQRADELRRRRDELERGQASYKLRADAVVDVAYYSGPELREAFDRVGRPRIKRILGQDYRRSTPATKRTLTAWRRLERHYSPAAPDPDAVEQIV